MSIKRALIKFKGDVLAAADYIFASAPIEPPKYVRSGEFFYPLVSTTLGYQAGPSSVEAIQDKDTFIEAEDLRAFNDEYDNHLTLEFTAGEDDEKTVEKRREVENFIHTFEQPENPAPNDTSLPLVYDTTGEEVDFREFKPVDISPGENDFFLFTYKVKRFAGEKEVEVEKQAYMSLDTAQRYLETAARVLNNWLLHGLLARLITPDIWATKKYSAYQFKQLYFFEENKYSLDFTDDLKMWKVRFFVNGKQFAFEKKRLYTGTGDDIYTILRQQETKDNPHPEYLLFRMIESSAEELFVNPTTDRQKEQSRTRREELSLILFRMIARENIMIVIDQLLPGKTLDILGIPWA